ncbi:hypothetical protein FV222_02235 [Methylobacterium sp. WL103]|uniref:hypothetical protein n=1 Tax=Methylobacterium sp. WL103 TaxID=2603891 RepID=UPI0011CAB0EF|nr:hypothetical protein [Methylobacterium sp. WL103]TXN07502.1 hypothetical protein FV222_02235 [Methylobacterium sp. WL103]
MDQNLFDFLADALVAERVEVSYTSIQNALLAHNAGIVGMVGKKTSDRDIQAPFANWRKRRNYKKHFALLDIPDAAEKLIAKLTREAISMSRDHLGCNVGPTDDLEKHITKLEMQENLAQRDACISQMAAENHYLIEALAAFSKHGRIYMKGGGKKRGIPASTSLHFWDQLMQHLASVLRTRGPMTADELCSTIDAPTKALAAVGFEPITPISLDEKLRVRVDCDNYFVINADGRFDIQDRRVVYNGGAPSSVSA